MRELPQQPARRSARATCVAASAATTPRRGTCSTARSSITIATRAIRSRRSTSAVKCAACHFTTRSGAAAQFEVAGAADQRRRLSEADVPLADVGLRLHAVPRQRARLVAVRAEGVQAVPLGEGRVHAHQLRPQPAHALPARRRARRREEGAVLRLPSRRSRRASRRRAARPATRTCTWRASPRCRTTTTARSATRRPTGRPICSFDHGAHTKFPLTGAHANADCRACHRGKGDADWENVSSLICGKGRAQKVACMGCHQHENVHQKQYTNDRCLECHKMAGVVETKPRAINEFHGPNSRFPLTEGHKGVACDKCHPGNVFKENTPLQCGPKLPSRRAAQGHARQGLPQLPHRRQVGGAPLRSRHQDEVAARRQSQGRVVRGLPPAARLRQQPRQAERLLQLPQEGRRARRRARHALRDVPLPDGEVSFDHNDPEDSRLAARGQAQQGALRRLP